MKRVREREKKEQERREKWRTELKQKMSNAHTYSIGHLPGSISAKNAFSGSYITSNTITSADVDNSNIIIDGGPNGSMKIDVPLIVNGRDVVKELDEMRDSLLLLKRDVDMEAKYPRLKEIKDEYERALEKYKTFEAIKESK